MKGRSEGRKEARGAEAWIERLDLEPHPEGGYFREIYRSPVTGDLPRFGERELGTSIYFLITDDAPSRLHRLRSEEIWNWHAGSPVTLHVLDPEEKEYVEFRLSGDPDDTGEPQRVVPPGCWFGATVDEGYALVGCTVLPGFRFEDFELGERERLLREFPEHEEIVRRLTRD